MVRFIRRLQSDPCWQSLAEVFLTVFFTFFPIALLSVPLSDGAGTLDAASIRANFMSYWASGQLVLPILGLSGAISTLLILNSRAFNRLVTFIALFFSVGCAIAGGFALAESDGFSKALYPEIIYSGFVVYAAMLVLWLSLSVLVRSDKERGNPEERAVDLLAQKKAAMGGDSGT